jgi:hypothetical protein
MIVREDLNGRMSCSSSEPWGCCLSQGSPLDFEEIGCVDFEEIGCVWAVVMGSGCGSL